MSAHSFRRLFRALVATAVGALALSATASAFASTLQPAFDQAQIGTAGYTRAWGVAVADFNSDGLADYVTGDTYGDVKLFIGDGTGNFTPQPTVVINAAYHNAYGLAAGDFNGDGKADIAMSTTADGANDGVIYYYKGNGNGTFASSGFPQLGLVVGDVGTNVTIVASADVDGDGDYDLVGGDVTASANARADVVLFRNSGLDGSGNPVWSAETLISAPDVAAAPESPPYFPPTTGTLAGYGLSFGDVDGDGDEDLFVTDRAGYVYVWGNTDGAGHFAPVRFDNISTGTRPYAYAQVGGFQLLSIAAGDLNGDGRCDFATGYTLDGSTDGKVALYLNEGMSGDEPLFAAAGIIGGNGTDSRGLTTGQLNQAEDSYLDVLFGNSEGRVYGLFADLTDTDADGIVDRFDNIADVANFPTVDLNGDGGLNRLDQIDLDGDGLGSVLVGGVLAGDPDADGDAVLNADDNLPFVPNPLQLDRDGDGVGEVDGPWPLCTLGDPLDDRDPDGDGIPNGPFDPALTARYRAAKQKLMTGDTPIILRIDALGRWWQAEFTQTLADSICMDEATFAAKYGQNWDGTFGSGATPPAGLQGGHSLPVSLMLIPKMLWTDPTVVGYLTDRLQYPTFELGQHGTYHTAIQRPASLPDSEMNGYDPLEMYAYLRVGQDTMLGTYDRVGASDVLSAGAGDPAVNWAGAANPLISFAPPYDEFDVAGAEASARLGYAAFTSDVWVEGEDRTLMPDYSDEFDPFGALHAAAMFMPYGTLDEIPWWFYEPDHDDYADYIGDHLQKGNANVILIEEVNFSGKSGSPAAVDNTIDAEKWANFQTMLDVVEGFDGGVPMTLGEYAMARAFDNAPEIPNPDQADVNHNGIGDVAETPVANADGYVVDEDDVLTVTAPGVLGNDAEPDGQPMSAALVDSPEHGDVDLHADGSFGYTPDDDYFGEDTFTYTASDGAFTSAKATVTITVRPTNDPPTISATPAEQSVQYSDPVSEIEIAHGDIDAAHVTLSDTGLPNAVAPYAAISFANEPVGTGGRRWYRGNALVPAGSYPTTFTVTDPEGAAASDTETITVLAENADVDFDSDNPTAVRVPVSGGSSGPIMIGLVVSEPDDGNPGDITLASVHVRFVPVAGGSPITGAISGPDADGRVTANATGLPVGAYSIEVTVDGGYYAGANEDVITITDPTGASSSGGGWISWPTSGEKTTFGFTAATSKKGSMPKGGAVAVRHTPSGIFRMKSNALTGVSSGSNGSGASRYGWATMTGKCTYIEPGWLTAEGNCTFTLYAEDRGEPGVADRFWLEVRDRTGTRIANLSLPAPATSGAATLRGGNVSVPYRTK